MKKIALISTFCNNDEKIEVLRKNLIEFKKLGVDTMVLSPLQLPSDIIELSDFVFFTKENPVLSWPIRAQTFWVKRQTKHGMLVLHNGIADYGWAALYQFKKLFQIASTYDYNIYYQVTYDLVIDDVVKSAIESNKTNLIYPRQNINNPEEIFDYSLHFNIFDKNNIKNIGEFIDYDRYLNNLEMVAEYDAYLWSQEFGIEVSEEYVKDYIYYHDGNEHFNHSLSDKYKMFYTRPYNLDEGKMSFIFYELKEEVKININDVIYENIDEFLIYKTDIDCEDVTKFIVYTENEEIDYTEQYNLDKERNVAYYE